MKKYYLGVMLILLSTLGFGVMPIFAVYAYKGGITVPMLLFLRFLIASLILLSYVVIKYRKLSLTKRDLLFLFILGGICYTLQSTSYFSSVRFISPALASIILYTYPIIVAILSFFVDRERITIGLTLSMALSFAGMVMVLGTSSVVVDWRGVALALAAAFIYSCYIVLGNRVVKQLEPIVVTTFVSIFATAGLFVLGLSTGGLGFGFDVRVWLAIGGLIIFSTILAILTFFRGLELLGPTKSSIISMLEPVFTALLSMLLFKEKLEPLQVIGGIAVLAGALLVVLMRQTEKKALQD